jgi:hypothetical protein
LRRVWKGEIINSLWNTEGPEKNSAEFGGKLNILLLPARRQKIIKDYSIHQLTSLLYINTLGEVEFRRTPEIEPERRNENKEM